MMNKKIMAVLVVTVFLLSSFGILIPASGDVDASSKGTLVVETSPDFAPYDYYYGTEYVGIDLDILRAIGMDLGYTIEFRQNRFDSIITSVTAGNCHMGSGFTITDERKKSVNFSTPYAAIKQVVVGKAGQNITSESDLDGKRLVAQLGSSGEAYAAANLNGNPNDAGESVTGLNTYSDIVLGLLSNAYDFEIVDHPVAEAQVSASPDLQIYDILDAKTEYYGFIFNKNNTQLLQEINGSLDRLIDNGTIDAILKYYSDNGYRTDTPSYYAQEPTLFIISDDVPPYSYERLAKQAGIDADVLTAVADKMGYKIRFVDVRAVDLVDTILRSPNYIGAGSLAIREILNEKGEQDVVFSDTYATDKLVIVTSNGSSIAGADDLSGKEVAVLADSKSIEYVSGKGGKPFEYETVNYAMDAVYRGEKDCAIVDYASAKAVSYGYGNSLKIKDALTDAPVSELGFLFSASAVELMAKFNMALAEIKADGTVDKIQKYYSDNEYDPDTSSFFDDTDNSFWGKLWNRIQRCFLENDRWELYLTGLENTLKITAIALVIGTIIGFLIAAVLGINAQTGRLWPLALLGKGYITIIRGTPAMIQLLLIYYVVFASSSLNAVFVASIAFGINSGAYVAEIVRSGINSVPKGQMEAARCLGLSTGASMKSVIVPQAIRNILPALGNETISLLKETSIAGFIGVIELTRAADIIRGQTYDAFVPLIAVALIYLVIVFMLQFLIKRMERRLNNAY